MAKYVTNDTELTSIANAIRTKGGTSGSLSYPEGFVQAIQDIPTGGGGGNTAVKFYDYDGTLIAEKAKEEINAMTSDSDLPANPSHEGLVAQGWNWTVAQLKAQLLATPDQIVYVGQMYITESGATEIDVELESGRLYPTMTIAVSGTVVIDWGDNTTPDTLTGTSTQTRKSVPHMYSSAGNYTIKVSANNANTRYRFYGTASYTLLRKDTTELHNRFYTACIKRIRIGSNMTGIDAYSFYNCSSITDITIPNSVVSVSNNAFCNCYNLVNVIIPSDVQSIGSSAFSGCYSLYRVSMPSGVKSIFSSAFSGCYSLVDITMPNSVTKIEGNAFYNCYALANLTIPSGVTSIGGSAFYNCRSITSITIPAGITSIGGSMFYGCSSLKSITIPNSVTSIGNNAFYGCFALSDITIPSGVTSIGTGAFYQCMSLKSITIPSGVTSISSSTFYNCFSLINVTIPSGVTSIGGSAFYGCYALASVTIPSSVTSIKGQAFYSCQCVAEYHIKSIAAPTLETNVFYSIVSDCVIYVPAESVEAYKTATNWSTYASHIQAEPA